MKKLITLVIMACTPLFTITSQRKPYLGGIRPQTKCASDDQKWATLSARKDVYTAMIRLGLDNNLTKQALNITDAGLSRFTHTVTAQEEKLGRAAGFDTIHYQEQIDKCLSRLLNPQLAKKIEAEMLRQSQ